MDPAEVLRVEETHLAIINGEDQQDAIPAGLVLHLPGVVERVCKMSRLHTHGPSKSGAQLPQQRHCNLQARSLSHYNRHNRLTFLKSALGG